jgi:multidrug efflux pump subunit AcrA (membrane-fusion protein)
VGKPDHAPRPGKHIWVLRDGRPVPVPIETGATDGSFTVVSGAKLREGEEVIVGMQNSDSASSSTRPGRPPF